MHYTMKNAPFSKMLSEVMQFYTAFENRSGTSTRTESLLISIIIEKIEKIMDRLPNKLLYFQHEFQNKRKDEKKARLWANIFKLEYKWKFTIGFYVIRKCRTK